MKILVIDDHVLIREAMRGVLRELKGEAAVILEASDSRQAMRQIEQNPEVELVLLDLGLPDRDGLEMRRHRRADAGDQPFALRRLLFGLQLGNE
jgi:DNA-binding NarL/FixJ family response regulator